MTSASVVLFLNAPAEKVHAEERMLRAAIPFAFQAGKHSFLAGTYPFEHLGMKPVPVIALPQGARIALMTDPALVGACAALAGSGLRAGSGGVQPGRVLGTRGDAPGCRRAARAGWLVARGRAHGGHAEPPPVDWQNRRWHPEGLTAQVAAG